MVLVELSSRQAENGQSWHLTKGSRVKLPKYARKSFVKNYQKYSAEK